jgi:hypothetical protein
MHRLLLFEDEDRAPELPQRNLIERTPPTARTRNLDTRHGTFFRPDHL